MRERNTKIYVTKWALTQGILEVMASVSDEYPDLANFGMYGTAHGRGREWHITAQGAIDRCEEMRRAKLASIRRQIKRIEAMTFEPKRVTA